jgi:hypothetical protein
MLVRCLTHRRASHSSMWRNFLLFPHKILTRTSLLQSVMRADLAPGQAFLHTQMTHTTGHPCNVEHFHVAQATDSQQQEMHTNYSSVKLSLLKRKVYIFTLLHKRQALHDQLSDCQLQKALPNRIYYLGSTLMRLSHNDFRSTAFVANKFQK